MLSQTNYTHLKHGLDNECYDILRIQSGSRNFHLNCIFAWDINARRKPN